MTKRGCTDRAEDLYVQVPQGNDSQGYNTETSGVITDLVENGQEYIVAMETLRRGAGIFVLPLGESIRISKMGELIKERELEFRTQGLGRRW